jgi:protein O-mannosyl-transferase
MLSLGLIVIPFLPATNLFFRVGFVVAERILFISVAGYCMLVVYGFEKLNKLYPYVKVTSIHGFPA